MSLSEESKRKCQRCPTQRTAGRFASGIFYARTEQLYLTHVSRRYRERDILDEAKAIFPNAIVARDFDQYKIAREK